MTELLASALRLSTPLLFAGAGGLICERAGIATICLEGVMLTAAWTAAVVNLSTHNPWYALLAGVAVGSATMLLHAFLSITAKADQIVSGVAINIFAAGLTPLLNKFLYDGPTNTPAIPMEDRFHVLAFDQYPLVYLALLIPFLLNYVLYHTSYGLRVLAAGDGPEALRTSGVSPSAVRYLALWTGGAIASLGGVYLSISHASQFTRDMTAGRGYIALTALIFGKWRPIPTFFACLFFGLADALQIQLQSTTILGISFPVQLIQAMPYVITLVVLVGVVGKSKPPLSIGQKY